MQFHVVISNKGGYGYGVWLSLSFLYKVWEQKCLKKELEMGFYGLAGRIDTPGQTGGVKIGVKYM